MKREYYTDDQGLVYRIGKDKCFYPMGMKIRLSPNGQDERYCGKCGGTFNWKDFLNRSETKIFRQCSLCREQATRYVDTWRKKNKIGRYKIKEGAV